MNELQVFGFEGRNVRVVEVKGEPWWVAKDVADVLGYSDTVNAVKAHCKGVANYHPLSTGGGVQDVRIIALSDVLRLIVGSRLPGAVRFESWVFEEVLPAIMKTGSYGTSGLVPNLSLPGAKMRELRILFQHGAIDKTVVQAFLFKKQDAVTTVAPLVPAASHHPLADFLSRQEFSGWRESLKKDPRAWGRLGIARRIYKGDEELLIEHENKTLTKIAGHGYKTPLREDPAYKKTVQAHINRQQVSCLVFDMGMV